MIENRNTTKSLVEDGVSISENVSNDHDILLDGSKEVLEKISDTKNKIDKTDVLKNGLRIENVRGNELSPEEIREISDFYLEIFRNAPYSQFLLKKDDPLNPISPQEYFGNDKKYFSLEETELKKLPEGYAYWMERDRTAEVTAIRMNEDTYISRMFDEKTGELVGLVYGRRATLKEIFETEEMKNPLFLSDYIDESLLVDDDRFYGKMKEECGLEKNKDLFFVSCVAVHPSKRNNFDNFFNLMKNFSVNLDSKESELRLFGEIEDNGAAHDIDLAIAEKEVIGILGNGHSIFISKVGDFKKYFLKNKNILIKKVMDYKNK